MGEKMFSSIFLFHHFYFLYFWEINILLEETFLSNCLQLPKMAKWLWKSRSCIYRLFRNEQQKKSLYFLHEQISYAVTHAKVEVMVSRFELTKVLRKCIKVFSFVCKVQYFAVFVFAYFPPHVQIGVLHPRPHENFSSFCNLS